MNLKSPKLALAAILVLAMALIISLIACNGADKPFGTYEKTVFHTVTSYTFEGDKYILKIGTMRIEGTFEVEKKSKEGAKWSEILFMDSKGNKLSAGYELKGDTLILGGQSFIKKR